MGIFRRPPKDIRPTEEQVKAVAAKFNAGDTDPADELEEE